MYKDNKGRMNFFIREIDKLVEARGHWQLKRYRDNKGCMNFLIREIDKLVDK